MVITMLIPIISLILVFLIALIKGIVLSKYQFVCSCCDKEFHAKWYQLMFESHFGEYFRIRCPHCNEKKYHRCLEK